MEKKNQYAHIPNLIMGLGILLVFGLGCAFFLLNQQFFQFSTESSQDLHQLLKDLPRLENIDPEQAKQVALIVIEQAESLGDIEAKAIGYYWLGKIYLIEFKGTENASLSLAYLKFGKRLISQVNNTYWRTLIDGQLASAYNILDKPDSVEYYLNLAWEQNLKIRDGKDSAYVSATLLRHEASLKYKLGYDPIKKAYNQESLVTSRNLWLRSLNVFKQIGDLEGELICLRNLGVQYSYEGIHQKADSLFNEALLASQNLGSKIAQKRILIEMGINKVRQINQKQIQPMLNQSVNLFKKGLKMDSLDRSKILYEIGKAYHQAAYTLYINPKLGSYGPFVDSASAYYNQAIETAIVDNNFKLLEVVLRAYTEICEDEYSLSTCVEVLAEGNKAHFSLSNSTKDAWGRVEKDFQRFKLNALEERNKNQKNTLLFGSCIILSVLLILAGYFYSTLQVKFLRQQLASKLLALQAQMNPHFISNSLNAIESLINLNKNREASDYLVKFSHLARLVLEHSQQNKITISDEIQLLENYLELEKLRMSEKLDYKFKIDTALNAEQTLIPPMLIQPFVENAVWHGIKDKPSKGKIVVQFLKESEKQILCMIEDDGIGREQSGKLREESAFPKFSHSTRIIQERVQLLKEQYGTNLHITDLKNPQGEAIGTRVEIFIQLITEREHEIT